MSRVIKMVMIKRNIRVDWDNSTIYDIMQDLRLKGIPCTAMVSLKHEYKDAYSIERTPLIYLSYESPETKDEEAERFKLADEANKKQREAKARILEDAVKYADKNGTHHKLCDDFCMDCCEWNIMRRAYIQLKG